MEFLSLLLLAQIKEKNVSIVTFKLFNTAIVMNRRHEDAVRSFAAPHYCFCGSPQPQPEDLCSLCLHELRWVRVLLSGDLSWFTGQVLQILARWCRVVRRLQGHVRGGWASCWICGSHVYSGEGEWKLGLMHRECWCILPPVIADTAG